MANQLTVESLEPWLADCLLGVSSCMLEVNDQLAAAARVASPESRIDESGSCIWIGYQSAATLSPIIQVNGPCVYSSWGKL